MVSKKLIQDIAKICHEANRAYCQTIGDDSQCEWQYASEWQKDSAFNGVLAVAMNINITPEKLHQNWMREKLESGWTYGEVKDAEKKTHPCLIEYDHLPAEQRKKDEIFHAICRVMLP